MKKFCSQGIPLTQIEHFFAKIIIHWFKRTAPFFPRKVATIAENTSDHSIGPVGGEFDLPEVGFHLATLPAMRPTCC
jgi:hypothetical protein